MKLDEQISLMEELLSDDDHWSCENAKSEYRQVLEWLKDYRRLLEMPKGDLISREALKQMLPAPIEDEYKRVHQIIDNIPSVPDRPQGYWVEKEETPASVSYYCSVCKTEGIPITPFCPWCGAKMKGDKNETN